LRPCIDNSNKSGERVPGSDRKKGVKTLSWTIFRKPEYYEALEQILAEGQVRYACWIFAWQLMPNHWRWGSLSRWLEEPEGELSLHSAWSWESTGISLF
jgi:hypothetical protein